MSEFNDVPYDDSDTLPKWREAPRPILLERFKVVLGRIVWAPLEWDIVLAGPLRAGDRVLDTCALVYDRVTRFEPIEDMTSACEHWLMVIRHSGKQWCTKNKRDDRLKTNKRRPLQVNERNSA